MPELLDSLQSTILKELTRLVEPLEELRDGAAVVTLLTELGWQVPAEAAAGLASAQGGFNAVANAVEAVQAAVYLAISKEDPGDIISALPKVQGVFDATARIKDGFPAGIDFFDNSKIKDPGIFFGRLGDYLLITYLERRQPLAHAILTLAGLMHRVVPKPLPPHHHNQGYRAVDWEEIPRLFTQPFDHLAAVYAWGKDDLTNPAQPKGGFDEKQFFANLLLLTRVLGISGGEYLATDNATEMRYPIFKSGIWGNEQSYQEFGLALRALMAQPPQMRGLALLPYLVGSINAKVLVSPRWALTLQGALQTKQNGLRLELRPEKAPILTGLPIGRTDVALTLQIAQQPNTPSTTTDIFLIGQSESPFFLRLRGISSQISFKASNSEWLEAALDIGEFALNLTPRTMDNFLAKILPAEGVNLTTGLGFTLSNGQPPRFKGSGGLEINWPINKSLGGVVNIISLFLSIKGSEQGIETIIAATGGIQLGPLSVRVDRIGLLAKLVFSKDRGPNIVIGFKPPNGAGLSVDASAIVGGGYLFFDNDKGQYGGVLQLEVKGGIAIKAIGLITTKMPDGSPGFSFLIIITVEFPPIQLGYGFTLNGLGGLAGFNRTMKLDALRDGIKNRTLDSIMFPPDPVANAQKIISDLQAVFPPAPGRFVFAPMVKLGWGVSVLEIEVGLVVELPMPLRLAIMGKIHLKLPPIPKGVPPTAFKPPVEIHMFVLGTLDFDKGEVSVDAVLYDSYLAVVFPLTGGMAMRLRWGSDPVFAMAIGGFNPRFAPPPGFPEVDRLALQFNYEKPGLARILLRLEAYLALTANSLQFGARLDVQAVVTAGPVTATIIGYLGFDALIEFFPFHFVVDIYGAVTVKAYGLSFSIDLLLVLSGPMPIVGNGKATIDFFGKREFQIDFSIGLEPESVPPLPPANPLAELIAALEDLRNWSAALPAGNSMLVTLRQLSVEETKDKVLAHPLGELTMRQKVLPFGIPLERFGAAVPDSPGPFDIGQFRLGTNKTVNAKPENAVRDSFARGQFVNLSEDEKLTTSGFESFRCGQTRIGTGEVSYGPMANTDFEYDVTVIDNKEDRDSRSSRKDGIQPFLLDEAAFLRAAQFGAAKQTPMGATGSAKFAGPSQGIKVKEQTYSVASTADLKAAGNVEFDTYTEAEAARRRAPTGKWQVVEAYEAV